MTPACKTFKNRLSIGMSAVVYGRDAVLIQISVMLTGLERCQCHIAAPAGGLKATKTNCCYFRTHANMWCGTARGPDPPPLQSPTGFPERDAWHGHERTEMRWYPSVQHSLWSFLRINKMDGNQDGSSAHLPDFSTMESKLTPAPRSSHCMIHAPDRAPRACDDIDDNMTIPPHSVHVSVI